VLKVYIMPHLENEIELKKQGYTYVAGTDEAGRGPWVGPVVAAAVCFQNGVPEDLKNALDDSKKLSAKKREILYEKIKSCGALYGIGEASAQEIDEINILQASFLAMKRALEQLESKGPKVDFVLVDGNRLPNWKWPSKALIGGDGISLSISAASILAKVTRDNQMKELAKEYPYYGWEKNAGYGAPAHIVGLKEYGITPHHRKSYAPIKKIIEENKDLTKR